MTVAAKETPQTQELEGYFRGLGYGAGFGKPKNILMETVGFFFEKLPDAPSNAR